MDWENHSEKNSIKKSKKTVKINVKLPHVSKKALAIKRNFVQTPYSQSKFKFRLKKFTPENTRFLLYFLFRRDQNHYSNLTSEIMKMCEQILKKDIAPIQFKFFELLIKGADSQKKQTYEKTNRGSTRKDLARL